MVKEKGLISHIQPLLLLALSRPEIALHKK